VQQNKAWLQPPALEVNAYQQAGQRITVTYQKPCLNAVRRLKLWLERGNTAARFHQHRTRSARAALHEGRAKSNITATTIRRAMRDTRMLRSSDPEQAVGSEQQC
jgi:hypothetical protein